MNKIIRLHGKAVHVELTPAAARALERRAQPLLAEVHLVFGCMIAKRVWFKDEVPADAVAVTPLLSVIFRPVRYTKTCTFDDIDNGAVPEDYPMVAQKRGFVPDAVRIDFHGGQWFGDFTYNLAAYRSDAGD